MATRRKHKATKQTLKKADDPVSKLSQQWKKCGVVIMNSTFMPMAQEMFNYLCEQSRGIGRSNLHRPKCRRESKGKPETVCYS